MPAEVLHPVACTKCLEFLNEPARVFPSEDHLQDPDYMKSLGLRYLGQDQFAGDPITSTAVWPGKSNATLHPTDWQLCCPMHPNCSHEYEAFNPHEHASVHDEIDEIFDRGRRRDEARMARTAEIYRQNDEANAERIRLERIYGPIRKSDIFSLGVWEEPTCCHEPNDETWLSDYIEWKSKKLPLAEQ